MLQPSRITIGKLGRLLVYTALLGLLVSAGSAFGQLTEQDIEQLQQRGEREGWTFEVSMNPACEYTIDELCGLEEPPNWREGAKFNDMSAVKRTIPEQFDWRDSDGVTPVRNQGGCGSCWAFGSVGALECNIKIFDGEVVDLSEQWLVSCNQEGWGCGGGWWVLDYFVTETDPCGGTGAVMESDFPYVQYDAPCSCPYPHEYTIKDWGYVGSPWSTPTVEQMKLAIMEYGPIAVAVSVNNAFQGYSNGVFNGCENGDVNHAVVLVGWDDSQGTNGVWIMRNSWGTWWGESGYMRIPYGCSRIGYNAVYVDYAGGVSIEADTTSGWVPFDVNFTGVTTMSDVDSWAWSFGDGDSAFVQSPSHTYTQPGLYTVGAEVKAGAESRSKQKVDYIMALADSVVVPDTIGATRGSQIEVAVRACNNVPIRQIQLPVEYPGDLAIQYDSFSTIGCRTEHFETQTYYHYDPAHQRVALLLKASESATDVDMLPGNGPIAKLYFTIPDGVSSEQEASINLSGYGTREPCFIWPMLEYHPIGTIGVVKVSGCCEGTAGNINGDPAGDVDLSDVIYLVNALFNGGPPPPCPAEANVDGDAACSVDLPDVIYLVNALFGGGPAPSACMPECE